MKIKSCLASLFCVLMLFALVVSLIPSVSAAAGPTITTTLTDHAIQKGSKKTFDVWARNAAGDKIKATVALNGEKIAPTWDDNEKTSYTLIFSHEGENTVTVSATSDGGRKKQLTYHIDYQRAKPGEAIGVATWSVELFTIGCGYLIEPVQVKIYEGETSAEQLIRLLHDNGYVSYYGGTPKASFYLGYIADGDATAGQYNSYTRSGTPSSPKKLNLSPKIPAVLAPHLHETMSFYDPDDYTKNWAGYLGEFAFTNGSGWMYAVNNVFPNVGFADTYLSDGDVVRVQFTLGYGADIGGFGAMGTDIPDVDTQPSSGYFPVADKDALTESIAQALSSGLISRSNVREAYLSARSVMETLNASQSQVNTAVNALNNALAHPSPEQPTVPPSGGTPSGGTSSGGTSSGGASSGGTSSGGTSSGGTPSGSTSSGGTPSGGTPSGGTPSGGTSSGGTSSGGIPSGGTPSGGSTVEHPSVETSSSELPAPEEDETTGVSPADTTNLPDETAVPTEESAPVEPVLTDTDYAANVQAPDSDTSPSPKAEEASSEPDAASPSESEENTPSIRIWLFCAAGILLLAGSGVFLYFRMRKAKGKNPENKTTQTTDAETKDER